MGSVQVRSGRQELELEIGEIGRNLGTFCLASVINDLLQDINALGRLSRSAVCCSFTGYLDITDRGICRLKSFCGCSRSARSFLLYSGCFVCKSRSVVGIILGGKCPSWPVQQQE